MQSTIFLENVYKVPLSKNTQLPPYYTACVLPQCESSSPKLVFGLYLTKYWSYHKNGNVQNWSTSNLQYVDFWTILIPLRGDGNEKNAFHFGFKQAGMLENTVQPFPVATSPGGMKIVQRSLYCKFDIDQFWIFPFLC